MTVLFFTKYTRKGASSRLRTYQYLDFFRANGLQCDVSPFFDDEYLEEVYRAKRHNKWKAFTSLLRRMGAIFRAHRYDKVVIEKELVPYFPPVFEWYLSIIGVRYIVDYDDAIFHNYDVSENPVIRFFLGRKIEKVVRYAGIVIAGNEYLRESFTRFGARRIELIPTVIDMTKYQVRQPPVATPFTIGWIGSPITFKYIGRFKPLFERLSEKYDIRIVYVGANKTLGLSNEEALPWSEETESEIIRRFDIGIMPLEDNIWERGKCGYKLIQYMGCGVPVIGTPIGVNDKLIIDGVNGYKAVTDGEWQNAFEKMMTNDRLENHEMGLAGRRIVEAGYSLQVYREVWLRILKETEKSTA